VIPPFSPTSAGDPFGRTRDAAWPRSPSAPVRSPGSADVHLWRCSLDLPAEERDRLGRLLSAEERERVSRLRFARDRDRATASRGWLRRLAGSYLDVSPHDLRIGRTPSGKPRLQEDALRGKLTFNLSDSQSLAVYAFAAGREVGVDVERVRADIEIEEIARRFFAAPELDWLESRPETDRPRAFFRCWTAKEAYVKARGEGLSLAPETFCVGFRDRDEAFLAQAPAGEPDGEAECERWSFRTFEPAEGYVGAVAVEGPLAALARFEGTLR
jgi:4'-phosphopantetheinyl transferase